MFFGCCFLFQPSKIGPKAENDGAAIPPPIFFMLQISILYFFHFMCHVVGNFLLLEIDWIKNCYFRIRIQLRVNDCILGLKLLISIDLNIILVVQVLGTWEEHVNYDQIFTQHFTSQLHLQTPLKKTKIFPISQRTLSYSNPQGGGRRQWPHYVLPPNKNWW